MILTLLILDSVLLAVAELMFLTLHIGSVPVPISALVAAVSLPWLISRAGRFGGTPLAAALPLVVWLATIGVFGFAGPGEDILLPTAGPQLWQSVLLLLAGLVPGVYALARTTRELAERPPDWLEDE